MRLIYKRNGCDIWQYRFQYKNSKYYGSTAETSKAAAIRRAKAERAKVIAEYAAAQVARTGAFMPSPAGTPFMPAVAIGPRHTFDSAAKKYWDLVGKKTENADKLWGALKVAVQLAGPNNDVAMLSDLRMQEIRDEYESSPPKKWSKVEGERSPSAINDMLRLVVRIRNYAADLLECRMHYELHPRRWLLPEPINTRELSLAEEVRLEATCERLDPEILPAVKFLLFTGLRETAGVALTRKQVDETLNRVKVDLKGRGREKVEHRVHLIPEAREILDAMRHPGQEYVFTTVLRTPSRYRGGVRPAGTRVPLTPKTFARRFRKVLKAAGIENFTVIDLRHTAATRLLRGFGSMELVRRLLGHTTEKCTRRYAALVDDDLVSAMEMTAAFQRRGLQEVRDVIRKHSAIEATADLPGALSTLAEAQREMKKKMLAEMRQAHFTYATAA